MKSALAALALVGAAAGSAQAPSASPTPPAHFGFSRAVVVDEPAGAATVPPQACAVLDSAVFAHARPSLGDLRLLGPGGSPPNASGVGELPYALTLSETAAVEDDHPAVLNLGLRAGRIVFDLAMPARPYSSVTLALDAHDYLGTATVTGMQATRTPGGVALGSFTVFDLEGQHLGRATTLPLAESTFPFLHIELTLAPSPGTPSQRFLPATVTGARVPASREAQTLYTVVAETSAITQRPRKSVATFGVPAHVPIERVSFTLDSGDATNFSRDVRVVATGTPPRRTENNDFDPAALREEIAAGRISRVRLAVGGRQIRSESLDVPATIGANGDGPVTVEVIVENGDDRPVPLRSVALSIRERRLCFDVPAAAGSLTLAYGDPKLEAPVYDFARLFEGGAVVRTARLGPELANPSFVSDEPVKTFPKRHPGLLWAALLAVMAVLGAVALRSAKRV